MPVFNAPPLTLIACGVLILAFCLVRYGPLEWQRWALYHFAFFPDPFTLAWQMGTFGAGDMLRLVSHAFLHVDWLHLLINTGFLLAFGSVMERIVGPWFFVLLFGLAAAAGALMQLAFTPTGEGGLMIGASGAVYGFLGAAVPFLFAGRADGGLGRGFNFIVLIMVLNIGFAWANNTWDLLGAKIAWQAHVGGFLLGLAFGALIWLKATRRR